MADTTVTIIGWGSLGWDSNYGWGQSGLVPSGQGSTSAPTVTPGELVPVSSVSSTGTATAPSFVISTTLITSGWGSSSQWGEGGWGAANTPSATASTSASLATSSNTTAVSGLSGTGSVSAPSVSTSLSFVPPSTSGYGYFDPSQVIVDGAFSVGGVSSSGSVGSVFIYSDPQVTVSGASSTGSVGDPLEISSPSFVSNSVSGSGAANAPLIGADHTVYLAGFGASSVPWGSYGWGQGSVAYAYGEAFAPNISLSFSVLSDGVSASGSATEPLFSISTSFVISGVSGNATVSAPSISSEITILLDGWSSSVVGWGEFPWGLGVAATATGSVSEPVASSVASFLVTGVTGAASLGSSSAYSSYVYTFSGWNESFISWGEYGWGQGETVSLYGTVSSPNISVSATTIPQSTSATGSVFEPSILLDSSFSVSGVSSTGSVGSVIVSGGTTVFLAGWNSNTVSWGDYGWGQGSIAESIGSVSSPSISADHTEFAIGVSASGSASNASIETNENISIAAVSYEAVGSVSVPEVISGVIVYLSGWGENGISWGDGPWGIGVAGSATGSVSDVFADGVIDAEVSGLSAYGYVTDADITSEVVVSLSGWNSDSFNWGEYGWGQGATLQAVGSVYEVSFSISEFYDSEGLSATASVSEPDVSLSSAIDVIGVEASGSTNDVDGLVETIVFLGGWNANSVSWGDGGWGLGSIASAIGTCSEASAGSIASFEVLGVSAFVFAGDVSTLDEITVYLAGWNVDSVSWGDYGWGQGAVATATGETYPADFASSIEFSVDGVSASGSTSDPLFVIDIDFLAPSIFGEGFVNPPSAQESTTVFLGGWGADGDGWGDLGWATDSFATASASIANVNDYWNAQGTAWGDGGWGIGTEGVRVLLFTEVQISSGAIGFGESFSPQVFISESQSFIVESLSAIGSIGLVNVPGDTSVSLFGVSGSLSVGVVDVLTPPNTAQISWIEIERIHPTVQVSWLEVERVFRTAQVSWLEVERVFRNVQVSWLFVTPYVLVTPTGVTGTGQASGPYVWLDVQDAQNPDWNIVPDSQNPNWNTVPDSQTPNWTNVPGDVSAGWQTVNDSQSSAWAEVNQDQNPSWNCPENSNVPHWMLLQDAQNSEWSCVNTSEGPNWTCADSVQIPGWSSVSDSQVSEWFQIAA